MDRKNEYLMSLCTGEYGEYLIDYRGGDDYICDAIHEIADNHTSIYYHQIMQFIGEHPEMLADVIDEGLYDPTRNYDIYSHGQAAEYLYIERDIYDNLKDCIKLLALDKVMWNPRIELTDELIELIEDVADQIDSNDRFSRIDELIDEAINSDVA